MNPKFTIVIPSYNQARFLREAIMSVVNQTYPLKELIVIDGGSTDGSVDIIREYEDHICYWVSEPDNGQSHAIGKGLQRATGDWCNWINSDDALLPGALEQVAAVVHSHPSAGLIGGRGVYGDENGCILRVFRPLLPWMWMPQYACCGQLIQQATFFSRRAYEAVGGVNTGLFYRMDMDLYERILLSGFRGCVTDAILGFFRLQADAKTAMHQDVRLRELHEKLAVLKVSKGKRQLALIANTICRICLGDQIMSRIIPRVMKAKSLSRLWQEPNCLA